VGWIKIVTAAKLFARFKRRLRYQYTKVKSGGCRVVVRLISRGVLFISRGVPMVFLTIGLIPVVVILRLIQPLVIVRIGYLDARRMGHFAVDVGTYLSERQLLSGNTKILDFLFLHGKPANTYLSSIVEDKAIVGRFVRLLWYANRLVPFGMRQTLHPAIVRTKSRTTTGLFYQSRPNIHFSIKEVKFAVEFLEGHGISPEKYVCLNARDSAYLDLKYPEGSWEYHDYRNVDVSQYIDAVQYLTGLGYGVVRMGRAVNDKIDIDDPLVFDYATSDKQSDFLDVWLMANCKFCISNGTGLDSVADIFNVPTLMTDFIPVSHLHTWQFCVTSPKKLFWEDRTENAMLTLSEMLNHRYVRSSDYRESRIRIENLSASEIVESVKEIEGLVSGNSGRDGIHDSHQDEFWKIFSSTVHYSRLHGFRHPANRISQTTLDQDPRWLS